MLDETLLNKQFSELNDSALLAGLVAALRPSSKSEREQIVQTFEWFTDWLEAHPAESLQLKNAVNNVIRQSNLEYIFSQSGLITGSGFFAELRQKLIEKFLPTLLPENDLRVAVRDIFCHRNDYLWITEIPESSWLHFFKTVDIHGPFQNLEQKQQLIEAAEILSYRVAALSLDKRILSKSSEILQPRNAFVEQNKEWIRYSSLAQEHNLQDIDVHAFQRMIQWLDLAGKQLQEIKQKKKEKGTSLQQTFITESLGQHLSRLKLLLTMIDPNMEVQMPQHTQYFFGLVKNENTHNRIGTFINQNFSYLAYQISEHSSHTGEKYITNNFKEYRQFFRSAAIGGVIISFAALIKMEFTNFHLPYFWSSFFYGLNYALAFIIIHFLHGSIATKQPALTASALAMALDNTNPKSPSLHNLAILVGKVIRSQFVSLLGNLAVVVPLTALIAWAMHHFLHYYIVKPEDVPVIIGKVEPGFLNTWYAAIAGVLLYLNGIVSGYFDNMVIYGKIPERLKKKPGFKKFFGEKRLAWIADYTDKNLGAIMGNIFLGFSLGFMIFFGEIFGFPLDIRHVTISTGFFGFAWFTSGYSLPWQTVVWCAVGLLIIAITNLIVSFLMALYTALKSRQISGRQLIPLTKLTMRYFVRYPKDFFLPPMRERQELHLRSRRQRRPKEAHV